jgi:hypothetical protein
VANAASNESLDPSDLICSCFAEAERETQRRRFIREPIARLGGRARDEDRSSRRRGERCRIPARTAPVDVVETEARRRGFADFFVLT